VADRKAKNILHEDGSVPNQNPNSSNSSTSFHKREEDSKKVEGSDTLANQDPQSSVI